MARVGTLSELCEVATGWIADESRAEYVCFRIKEGDHQTVSAVGEAGWAPLAQGVLIRTAETRKPLLRMLEVDNRRSHAVVGIPVSTTTAGTGAIVSIVECSSLQDARDCLRGLSKLSRLFVLAIEGLCERLRRRISTNSHLGVLARSISYDSVTQYCYAIANGLRVELDADLVAMGLVSHQTVRLSCISGLDEFDANSPGSRLIRESMEEAIDAGRPICVQAVPADDSGFQSDGHPLTSRWQQTVPDAAVASIPLWNSAGNSVAVIGVQGRSGQTLTSDELQAIVQLTDSLVAAIDLMKVGRRSLLRHGLDSAGSLRQAVLGRLRVQSAVALIATAVIACWMVFGVTDYIVRTPCTIVAAHTRQLTAPRDSILAEVLVRPGEIVEQGQLLAVLDTRQLEAERDRAEAQLRTAEIEIAAAAREQIPAVIGRAVSRREIAKAEVRRLSHQLDQSRILSPFRGQIISDDLTERTGELVPLGETLFEIVPDGELAVQLELPESTLAFVEHGQAGSFSVNARPGSAEECLVSRIEPEAVRGRSGNVVTGLATIHNQPRWLRPGMQGVVMIDTGERPVWWAWLHKAVDFVNFELWAWSGTAGSSDSLTNE